MRRVILIGLAGALAGCAATVPRPGGPPERGRGQLLGSTGAQAPIPTATAA